MRRRQTARKQNPSKMEMSSTLPRPGHGGMYPFQKEFSSTKQSSSGNNNNSLRDYGVGSVTPTLTPKNLHRGVGGVEGSNHHFSSCLYGVPPPSANMIKRTRNDEEFFGGFRRSSSLRRSHRENICPHHGNGNSANNNGNSKTITSSSSSQNGLGFSKSAIPGKAERTSSAGSGMASQPSGQNVNGGRPSYLQGTVSSVRRSRERPDDSTSLLNHGRNSSVRRSNSTISRNASFRSRKSSASLAATNRRQHSPGCQHQSGAPNHVPSSQLRYENELKGHGNNNNYYHLSHGGSHQHGDHHQHHRGGKDSHHHHQQPRVHRSGGGHGLAGSNNNLAKTSNLNTGQKISLNGNHGGGCSVHKNGSIVGPTNKGLVHHHHQNQGNVTGTRNHHHDFKSSESGRFPRTSSFSFRNGIFGGSGRVLGHGGVSGGGSGISGGVGIGEKPGVVGKSLSFSTV